jgi:hypothetical protein
MNIQGTCSRAACIAEFLVSAGQPMHIDAIVRHVSRKWVNLRKEDNLPQTSRLKYGFKAPCGLPRAWAPKRLPSSCCCRVAVEQALSSAEMQAALFFKQVEGTDLGDYWCLVDDDAQACYYVLLLHTLWPGMCSAFRLHTRECCSLVQDHDSDSDNDDDDAAAEGSQAAAVVQSFAKQLAADNDDIAELVGMSAPPHTCRPGGQSR